MADADLQRRDGTRICVGNRILSDGSFGTVKYIGQVPPTKGIWLGVDWDEPDRGKHNGTHEGKQYFETRNPKSGSFLRPKKAEFGVSCFESLKDRYGLIEGEDAGVVTDELFILGSNKKATVVEMVGAKQVNQRQSKLETLKDIGLRDCLVYGNGPGCQLKEYTPNITELNLSKNLIPSWDDVARIAEQLPLLHSLNVSDNCLAIPDNLDALRPSFAKVQFLFLNRMQYSWEQILRCSTMFPCLEQLHVCFNNLQSLSIPAQSHLPHLTLLNLDCNDLHSWEEILKVGMLPNLKTLMASENNIDRIQFADVQLLETTKYFPKLCVLSIMRNKIGDWTSMNELGKLATLSDLKLQGNPIWQLMDDNSVRQLIIAKIKTLLSCNNSKLTLEERKGAEIDYLKKFGQDWKKSDGNQDPSKNKPSQEFVTEHPRYQQFIDDWGAPEDSELEVKSNALKDNLLSVILSCPQKSEKGQITKKLPKTMSVQKVKTLVQRLFRVETGDIILTYKSQEVEDAEFPIDNDLRVLSFYSLENGDTILVRWK
ncbi:tubulin-specific chaperone E-like [Haliotis rubra]|uniref:tubulin-specific chaperone E-like n=1 Tax=Haliotis rubra TaxID=36100 RepID=UPI001EE557D8|nr:tubulin-specific chaperone E-like [Haliotis rubra]